MAVRVRGHQVDRLGGGGRALQLGAEPDVADLDDPVVGREAHEGGHPDRAADRLGFTFEGVFRQHMLVKDRNRDTAWYSLLDGEWPAVRAAFEAWLDEANFDAEGRQRRSLADLRAAP